MLNAQSTGLTHKLEFLPNWGDFMKRNIVLSRATNVWINYLIEYANGLLKPMLCLKRLGLGVAFISLFVGASAASTIRVDGNLHNGDDEIITTQGLRNVLELSVQDEEANSSFRSEADAARGILRVNSRVSSSQPNLPPNRLFGAGVGARIGESFTVSGTGTVSLIMQFDGRLSGAEAEFFADLDVDANGLTEVESPYESSFFIDVRNDEESFQSTIGMTFEIDGGSGQLDALWSIGGDAAITADYRTAFLEADNTAYLGIIASDGVTVTAFTDGFLSNPAVPGNPPAVPVPASLPILLSGVFLLAAQRRRSRLQ